MKKDNNILGLIALAGIGYWLFKNKTQTPGVTITPIAPGEPAPVINNLVQQIQAGATKLLEVVTNTVAPVNRVIDITPVPYTPGIEQNVVNEIAPVQVNDNVIPPSGSALDVLPITTAIQRPDGEIVNVPTVYVELQKELDKTIAPAQVELKDQWGNPYNFDYASYNM